MNKVTLIGRLTKDPDIRYTQGAESMCVARYTLAVDRRGKDKGADFINCVAFKRNGEFAEKYLHKGMKVGVSGRIQTGSYTNKDGGKVYTTDIVVEGQEFCEKRNENGTEQGKPEHLPQDSDGFMYVPDSLDEDLPFN